MNFYVKLNKLAMKHLPCCKKPMGRIFRPRLKCLGGTKSSKAEESPLMKNNALGFHQTLGLQTMRLKLKRFRTVIIRWVSDWLRRCRKFHFRLCIKLSRKNYKCGKIVSPLVPTNPPKWLSSWQITASQRFLNHHTNPICHPCFFAIPSVKI